MHVTLSGGYLAQPFLLAAGDIMLAHVNTRCHSKTTSNFNCETFGLSNVSKSGTISHASVCSNISAVNRHLTLSGRFDQ